MRIDILPEGGAAEGIEHRLYLVDPENKKSCLLSLLQEEKGSTLVFIRRRSDAEWLSRFLEKEGISVERIHSDLSQGQRVQALKGFREGEHRVLVATDIAARGIDVPKIEHIINYDMPDSPGGLHPPRRPYRPRLPAGHRLLDRYLAGQADNQGDRIDSGRGAPPPDGAGRPTLRRDEAQDHHAPRSPALI